MPFHSVFIPSNFPLTIISRCTFQDESVDLILLEKPGDSLMKLKLQADCSMRQLIQR